MRRFTFMVTALMVLTAFISGAQGARKLRVVTTIPDLKSLTEAVGGDLVDVDSLTRGTQNFHEAEVRPSMMLRLRRARGPRGLGAEPRGVPGQARSGDGPLAEADGARARREGRRVPSRLRLLPHSLRARPGRDARGPGRNPRVARAPGERHQVDEG